MHSLLKNDFNHLSKTKMEKEPKKVVAQFLSAVQRGDTQTIASLIHPSVRWNQPGDNVLSGTKTSSKEVFEMVGKMFELSAMTVQLTSIKSITENQNQVACLLNWKASSPAGKALDIDNIDVYTVENGQIVKADIFTTDAEVENSFWGK